MPEQLAEIPEPCHESIKLKYSQIQLFEISMVIYFACKISTLLYETICFLVSYSNPFLGEKLKLSRDFLEMFLSYSLILYIFRPRARWPEFYGVDLNTAKDSVFRNKNRPILEAKLTN